MVRVYIALGANLDSPEKQLEQACDALSTLAEGDTLQVSPFYRSVPMGDIEQPDYVNGVVSLDTSLSALELLHQLQDIETKQGRIRQRRWGPRTLDLDLLLYGQQHLSTPELTVPHYGMKQRSFVLVPLCDIAPELILPCGTPLARLVTAELKAELILLQHDCLNKSREN